ncbi:hypothetical protein PsYK624_078160 [Phanerochaete sordida]|uniref:Uncharacterized protein n=1 Tax=Phanerochaete sordida TaxID=48140 RepID=A0A9P3GBD5_9APHY|nr:hypothetical protein PsYK624_078160 [Phanerochaete sordida]
MTRRSQRPQDSAAVTLSHAVAPQLARIYHLRLLLVGTAPSLRQSVGGWAPAPNLCDVPPGSPRKLSPGERVMFVLRTDVGHLSPPGSRDTRSSALFRSMLHT